jgi:hypothetical protein
MGPAWVLSGPSWGVGEGPVPVGPVWTPAGPSPPDRGRPGREKSAGHDLTTCLVRPICFHCRRSLADAASTSSMADKLGKGEEPEDSAHSFMGRGGVTY